jgi:hypothetical protein
LARPEPVDRELLRAGLEQRSADWRARLRENPKVARELVRRLIGPITLWTRHCRNISDRTGFRPVAKRIRFTVVGSVLRRAA